MLEDLKKDIQWAIDRLHDIKGDEKALADIWAVIKRMDETMKMIDAEIVGYDREAGELASEDIKNMMDLQYQLGRIRQY